MEISTKKKKRVLPPLICAADIESKEVNWLWRPYIPRHMLTIIEGDPGVGKSWMTLELAAAVSMGRALPGGGPTVPQKVLMGSAEDLPEYTLKPRLESLECNMDNIFFLPNVLELTEQGADDIEQYMENVAATVLFIDPIQSYLGAGVDMNKANEVRPVMDRLSKIADRTGSAVICVRHLRKGSDDSPDGNRGINAGLGSIDFFAAARSVMQVVQNRGGDRILHHIKCSVGNPGPAMSYHLNDGESGGGAGFRWGDTINQSGNGHSAISTKPLSLADARDFVTCAFDMETEIPAKDIYTIGKARGFSESTILRASKDLVEKTKTKDGWIWRKLANDDTQQFPTG